MSANGWKNLKREMLRILEEQAREPEHLTVTEWANKYRWFEHGQSWKSQHGRCRYDIEDAPFQREPQDSLTNADIYAHCWKMASRIAKTVMMGNGFGYFSQFDPATQLFMYPTQNDANLRSRDEFQPMIDASPALRDHYTDETTEDDNTIAFKRFPGGSVAFVGSNAPSKLRARTARVVWCDEANGYRESSGKEGDPTWLAFNRAKNYVDAVRVVASTDTIKNHSTIDEWYQKSDKRLWFVQCEKCGVWQPMTWAQYRWPGDERWRTMFYCDSCNHGHDDDERREIILHGEYRPTAAFGGVRGYFLPGYYNIFPSPRAFKGKMHEIAEEAHNAKHSQNVKETTRVWVNTFLCEGYQEESDITPEIQPLLARREIYDRLNLPNEIILITFGTDFQADRVELVFWGHGLNEQKWRIEKTVFWGDPRMPEIYGRLESQLNEQFKRQDGATLRAKAGGFDTGYAACQRTLYSWLRPRLRLNWFAFKGASAIDADHVGRAHKSKVTAVTLLLAGTHRIKALIYNRALVTVVGPNYMHFPMSMKEDDFAQLFAEESHSVFKSGVELKEFRLPLTGNRRNEELDCAVLSFAAFYARGHTNFEYEEKMNQLTIADSDVAKARAEAEKKRRMSQRRRPPTLLRSLRKWTPY
jgi:phage terminase large subunit GpA-like protein